MILYVRKWQNRLGNNLNQLVHILHIALHYNYNIILPAHKFINKRYLVINKNIKNRSKLITAYKDFYKLRYVKRLPRGILNKNVNTVKTLMSDLFVYDSSMFEIIFLVHYRPRSIKPEPKQTPRIKPNVKPPSVKIAVTIIRS